MRRYILFFFSLSMKTRRACDEIDEYGLTYGRYYWMFAVFFLGLTAIPWYGVPDARAEFLLDTSELCTRSIGSDNLLHVSCQGSAKTAYKTITILHFTQVWQAVPDGKLRSYEEAVRYCADNEPGLPGSGWMLPNEDDFSDLWTALNPKEHPERIRDLLPKIAELGTSQRKSGLCYWAEFSETMRLQGLTYLREGDDEFDSIPGAGAEAHYSSQVMPLVNHDGFIIGKINAFKGFFDGIFPGPRRVCGIEEKPETRLPVLCIRGE